jgi:cytidylate kinase
VTVVAIDGPSGAGKSTVARAVARRLGWQCFDTGALYRAVALAALHKGLDLAAGEAVGELARSVDIEVIDDRVLLEGSDVTARVRAEDVTGAVSEVSAHPQVRAALLDRQRDAARRNDLVIEGRDIGTVVFPDASVKIFLTASEHERARRRCAQLELACDEATVRSLEREMTARDSADSGRATAPLQRAHDAVTIDSTDMDAEQVADRIVAIVRDTREGNPDSARGGANGS